ncbi:fimbrial protein [Serratia fonticola]|uniref:fimbrial protein n=1 Tax=Serratia fonticola TaxID=47917 RepID=UPI0013778CB3|nr:hypothetical protein [Serratia fonticola]NCG54500.1 hypothetical protein [Serratia fonticola]
MRKTLLTLTPAALVLLTMSGTTQAATNAQLTVTANVVASTCDVLLSTNALDLGNHALSAFSSVATPVAASKKTFTVSLNNCEVPDTAATASVAITGQTLVGHPTLFNTSGTNTGITFNKVGSPTAYLTSGDELLVATADATTPTADDFNGQSLDLQAGLASSVSSGIDIGAVSAPVLFSFVYN